MDIRTYGANFRFPVSMKTTVQDGCATPVSRHGVLRYHAVSSSLKFLSFDETVPLSEWFMASMTLAEDVLRHPGSAERRTHRSIRKHRLNRPGFQYPIAYLYGSAKKAGEHLHILATGGVAEPSPPSQVCLGCTFTQPPPTLRYGAGVARQTFASRFCLRQRVEPLKTFPQSPISPEPWWMVPRRRERQLRHHRSPSSVTGRPLPTGGIARGRWYVRLCIRVYASPMVMKRKSKMYASKAAMLIGVRHARKKEPDDVVSESNRPGHCTSQIA